MLSLLSCYHGRRDAFFVYYDKGSQSRWVHKDCVESCVRDTWALDKSIETLQDVLVTKIKYKFGMCLNEELRNECLSLITKLKARIHDE